MGGKAVRAIFRDRRLGSQTLILGVAPEQDAGRPVHAMTVRPDPSARRPGAGLETTRCRLQESRLKQQLQIVFETISGPAGDLRRRRQVDQLNEIRLRPKRTRLRKSLTAGAVSAFATRSSPRAVSIER